MIDRMKEIGHLIATQDNRCTDVPIFIVQQRKRIYGIDSDYTDDTVWIDMGNEGLYATPEETADLDRKSDDGEDTGTWSKVGYLDQWEFVTACFTEEGCEDFIAVNGHNLTEPRIYAAGSYRNAEFRAVRDYLKSIGTE